MLQRPKAYGALAVALILVAISIPAQVLFMFGYLPWEMPQVLARIAPLNWAVGVLAFLQAALLLRVSPLLWVSTPLFFGVVAWNNWLVAEVGLNASPLQALVATLGFVALHGVLLESDARRVLASPRLRWWLTPARRRAQLRTTVWPMIGGEMVASTFDISEGGAFISTGEAGWNSSYVIPIKGLDIGHRCSVRIRIDGDRMVACSAEVVRHQKATETHPAGVGLRFVGLTRSEREMLAEYVSQPGRSESLPIARAA